MSFLKISQNSKENTCAGVSFLINTSGLQLFQKRDPEQVFSCEFLLGQLVRNFCLLECCLLEFCILYS